MCCVGEGFFYLRLEYRIADCDSQCTTPEPVEDSPGFVENALLYPGFTGGLNKGLMMALEAGWTRAVAALLDGGASPQASSVDTSAVRQVVLRPTAQRLLGYCGIVIAAYDSCDYVWPTSVLGRRKVGQRSGWLVANNMWNVCGHCWTGVPESTGLA